MTYFKETKGKDRYFYPVEASNIYRIHVDAGNNLHAYVKVTGDKLDKIAQSNFGCAVVRMAPGMGSIKAIQQLEEQTLGYWEDGK